MDKQQKIVSMFDEIAKSYDLANRLLSLGIDVRWRKEACKKSFELLGKSDVDQIADIACGTGDMSRFWLYGGKRYGVKIKKVIGIDPSSGMLEIAKKKLPQVEFVQAEAKSLPLEDGSCDVVSITYGIRNVMEREAAFWEFYRILKSGGLLVILEFTKNENERFYERFMRFYIKKMLPFIGGLISKNYVAYKYLPDSIENFLTNKMMVNELQNIGFKIEFVKGYSGRISTLFIARKP